MRIDLSKTQKTHRYQSAAVRQIINRTLAIVSVLVGVFFIGAKLSEQVAENYLLSHFQIAITEANRTDHIEFPSKKFSAIYDLGRTTHDNYLDIRLSGADVYRVTFSLDDKQDFMIISTMGTGDANILHLIPESIVERGYDTIEVTPLKGNWDYWMEGISTVNDPDPADFADYQLIDFEIKKLEIEIDESDLAFLEDKAKAALDLGILLTEESDYVPAVIHADGKKDDAEIRLKGDWTDHLQEGKWSFRIKMDDEAPWGMKKFSIHRPETRDGVSEYLIQTFYREQGGIALRYDFADVLINGEYIGVYAIEEFFDKRLVENERNREGPIIKVNEDYMWERRAFYNGRMEDWDFGLDPDSGYMDFDVFGVNQTLESDQFTGYTQYAITELNKLIAGEVAVEEIFDIDQFAQYFAALDIFNSCHGNIWHNMRYYFNPITAKMEPVTFDELPREGLCESSSKRNDPLVAPFFKNTEFSRLYVQYLAQYLNEYDAFIEKEATNLAHIQTIFERDDIYFKDYTTHLDELHHLISSTLFEDDYEFSILQTSDDMLYLKINKKGFLNIHIDGITYDGVPVNADLSDYRNQITIDVNQQTVAIDDLGRFAVTYTSLADGLTHTVAVEYPVLDFAFYTAGHVYGAHDKADTAEQDFIHPPFEAALPGIATNEDIAFGFLTGDTVYQPSAASYGNLKSSMEITGKPYYIAPGNHDLDGSGLFAENFGSTYQSFVRDNSLFVILTPNNKWELGEEQLAFLEQAIQSNGDNVNSIFIITHYLFWLDGNHFQWIIPNGGPYQENRSNFWTDVKPLFDDYAGEVYFIAGDVGAFPDQDAAVYEREGNMHFIASGMGGGTEDNYLVVYVYDNGSVDFKLVPIGPDAVPLGNLAQR